MPFSKTFSKRLMTPETLVWSRRKFLAIYANGVYSYSKAHEMRSPHVGMVMLKMVVEEYAREFIRGGPWCAGSNIRFAVSSTKILELVKARIFPSIVTRSHSGGGYLVRRRRAIMRDERVESGAAVASPRRLTIQKSEGDVHSTLSAPE